MIRAGLYHKGMWFSLLGTDKQPSTHLQYIVSCNLRETYKRVGQCLLCYGCILHYKAMSNLNQNSIRIIVLHSSRPLWDFSKATLKPPPTTKNKILFYSRLLWQEHVNYSANWRSSNLKPLHKLASVQQCSRWCFFSFLSCFVNGITGSFVAGIFQWSKTYSIYLEPAFFDGGIFADTPCHFLCIR